MLVLSRLLCVVLLWASVTAAMQAGIDGGAASLLLFVAALGTLLAFLESKQTD